jgi:hypothetical protein
MLVMMTMLMATKAGVVVEVKLSEMFTAVFCDGGTLHQKQHQHQQWSEPRQQKEGRLMKRSRGMLSARTPSHPQSSNSSSSSSSNPLLVLCLSSHHRRRRPHPSGLLLSGITEHFPCIRACGSGSVEWRGFKRKGSGSKNTPRSNGSSGSSWLLRSIKKELLSTTPLGLLLAPQPFR